MKPSLRDDFVVQLGKEKIQTPAICAAVIDSDINSMKDNLEKALAEGADIVELRLDKLEDPTGWESLLQKDIPTIVTNRSKKEGGHFQGNENERIEVLLDAVETGVSCVDVELSTSKKKLDQILEATDKNDTSLIMSFHDFNKVPTRQELLRKANQMVEAGCDIAKLIGFANEHKDSLKILDFLIQASEDIEVPIITFAMGEKGKFTRVTAPLLGSPITYASIEEKTAPGQLDISAVNEILEKYTG